MKIKNFLRSSVMKVEGVSEIGMQKHTESCSIYKRVTPLPIVFLDGETENRRFKGAPAVHPRVPCSIEANSAVGGYLMLPVTGGGLRGAR